MRHIESFSFFSRVYFFSKLINFPSSNSIQDNIFLLSATIVNSRLYCMVVEVDDTKVWKLESKELKRLRSSFVIEDYREAARKSFSVCARRTI